MDFDSWRVALFVHNLTDERAKLFQIAPSFISQEQRFTIARPRTIGFSINVNFD